VDRCLARQPEDRPSAAELASQLAAWADATGAPHLELGPHLLHGGATLQAGKRRVGWQ
jgi:hypothetical protein